MANNRMYLRCKTCGEGFFMGKCFGGAYFTSNGYYQQDMRLSAPEEPDAFLDAYNKFLDEHAFCEKELNKGDIEYLEPKFKPSNDDLHYENGFEIAYEIFYGSEE